MRVLSITCTQTMWKSQEVTLKRTGSLYNVLKRNHLKKNLTESERLNVSDDVSSKMTKSRKGTVSAQLHRSNSLSSGNDIWKEKRKKESLTNSCKVNRRTKEKNSEEGFGNLLSSKQYLGLLLIPVNHIVQMEWSEKNILESSEEFRTRLQCMKAANIFYNLMYALRNQDDKQVKVHVGNMIMLLSAYAWDVELILSVHRCYHFYCECLMALNTSVNVHLNTYCRNMKRKCSRKDYIESALQEFITMCVDSSKSLAGHLEMCSVGFLVIKNNKPPGPLSDILYRLVDHKLIPGEYTESETSFWRRDFVKRMLCEYSTGVNCTQLDFSVSEFHDNRNTMRSILLQGRVHFMKYSVIRDLKELQSIYNVGYLWVYVFCFLRACASVSVFLLLSSSPNLFCPIVKKKEIWEAVMKKLDLKLYVSNWIFRQRSDDVSSNTLKNPPGARCATESHRAHRQSGSGANVFCENKVPEKYLQDKRRRWEVTSDVRKNIKYFIERTTDRKNYRTIDHGLWMYIHQVFNCSRTAKNAMCNSLCIQEILQAFEFAEPTLKETLTKENNKKKIDYCDRPTMRMKGLSALLELTSRVSTCFHGTNEHTSPLFWYSEEMVEQLFQACSIISWLILIGGNREDTIFNNESEGLDEDANLEPLKSSTLDAGGAESIRNWCTNTGKPRVRLLYPGNVTMFKQGACIFDSIIRSYAHILLNTMTIVADIDSNIAIDSFYRLYISKRLFTNTRLFANLTLRTNLLRDKNIGDILFTQHNLFHTLHASDSITDTASRKVGRTTGDVDILFDIFNVYTFL